jgi:predicted amidophosphoribosyltransferase
VNDLKKTRVDSTIAAVVPRLLNVLLPVNCVVCNTEGRYLCEGCEQGLPPLTRPYCYLRASPEVPQLCHWCFENSARFDRARAPYLYDGPAKHMVLDLKYRGVRIAAQPMALMLARYLERNPYPIDALVPVPLHSRRERQRGYNQSQLLC